MKKYLVICFFFLIFIYLYLFKAQHPEYRFLLGEKVELQLLDLKYWISEKVLSFLEKKKIYQQEANLYKDNKQFTILKIDDSSLKIISSLYGPYPWNWRIWSRLTDFLSRHQTRILAFDMIFAESKSGEEEFINSLKKFSDISVSGMALEKYQKYQNGKFYNYYFPLKMTAKVNENFDYLANISLLENEKYNPDGIIRKLKLWEISSSDKRKYFYLGALLYKLSLPENKNKVKIPQAIYLNYVNVEKNLFSLVKKVSLWEILAEEENEEGILSLLDKKYQQAIRHFRNSITYYLLKKGFKKKKIDRKIDSLLSNYQMMTKKLKLEKLFFRENQPFFFPQQILGIVVASRFLNKNIKFDYQFLKSNFKIEDSDEETFFRHQSVLVIPWALGFTDVYSTPIGRIRGGKLHLLVYHNLKHKLFLKRFTQTIFWSQFFLQLVLLIIFSFLVKQKNVWLFFLEIIFIFILILIIDIWLFIKFKLILESFLLYFYLFALSVYLFVYRYFMEYLERKKTVSLLSRYVSPQLAKKLVEEKDLLKLGGKRIEGSILFMDVCGFTSMSEKMPPEKVISILNYYFDKITKIVFSYDGIIDKFIGDAVMVLMGVFDKDEKNHAIKMLFLANEIREFLRNDNKYKLKFSFGINSGIMVCGNLGSSQRQDFTAIGDTVNTAARLEGIAQELEIVVGEFTYSLVEKEKNFEFEGPFSAKLKGKEKKVRFYKLKGIKLKIGENGNENAD